jgi:prepilin-type processing-associated H-X9-DG protein
MEMPNFSVLLGGDTDGKTTTSSAPSTSEFVVTKLTDASRPLLDPGEFFIADGTSNITDGTSNTAGAHTGGVNVLFGDGSVQTTDTPIVFSDYHLV